MMHIGYKTFLTRFHFYTQALIYKRYQGRYFARHSFNFCKVTGFDTNESIPFAKHSSALFANAFAVICISTKCLVSGCFKVHTRMYVYVCYVCNLNNDNADGNGYQKI
jgi:hypothetical protein